MPLLFSFLLGIGYCLLVLREEAMPRPRGVVPLHHSLRHDEDQSIVWLKNNPRQDYSIIGERNLFYDVATQKRSADPARPSSHTEVHFSHSISEAPTVDLSPGQEMISYVGLVAIEGDQQAILESVPLDETVFVRTGDEAFGYRVIAIEGDHISLSKNNRRYTVALGENKPDRLIHRLPRSIESVRPRTVQEGLREVWQSVEEQRFVEEHTRRHEIREQLNREREERERQQMEGQDDL
jgi:hypothetical protein